MRTEEEVRAILDQVDAVINEIVDANRDVRVQDNKDWAYINATSDVLCWVLGIGMQTSNFLSELRLEELKAASEN